jgi:hypothetical protein
MFCIVAFLVLAFVSGLKFFNSLNVAEKICKELLKAWKTFFTCKARNNEFKKMRHLLKT